MFFFQGLLGVFFRLKSPALTDDLPIKEEELEGKSIDQIYNYFDGLYDQASTNCFIAAGIYIGVFAFSFIQHKINVRANYVMS